MAARPPLDTGDHYQATVRVDSPGAGGRLLCSGTVIGPRLVLTAAHCVCKKRGITPSDLISREQTIKGRTVTAIVTASDCAPQVKVTTVRYSGAPGQSVPILRNYEGAAQAHPWAVLLFDEETAIWANGDLAVITLTKEVEGIAPVGLTGAEVRKDDRIVLVGYGTSDPNHPERRSGENSVSEIRELVSGGVEFVAGAQHLEDGGLASQLIPGDSGGGCFKVGDPTVLVGVNAAGHTNIWGEMSSTFTSVYAYKKWLEQRINDPPARSSPRAPRTARPLP